jgi:hypothetical protein
VVIGDTGKKDISSKSAPNGVTTNKSKPSRRKLKAKFK